MPAIPPPDQGSSDILTAARADAVQSLRDAGGSNLEPLLKGGGSAAVPATAQPTQAPDDAYSAEPPPDAVDMVPPDANVPPPDATPMPAAEDPSGWQKALSYAGQKGFEFLKGLGGATNQAASSLNTLLGAVPVIADKIRSLATGNYTTAAQDKWFKTFVDPSVDNAQAFATDKSADFVDKALNSAGNMLGVISQAVLTSPVEAATGLNTVKTAAEAVNDTVMHGTRSMLAPAAASAVQTGRQVLAETNDPHAAIRAAAVNYFTSTLGGIIPIGAPGKLATRMATGAASMAATGEASRELGNAELPAGSQLQQPFDPQQLVLDAMNGALMGGVMGERPPAQPKAPPAAAVDMPAGTPVPPAEPPPTTSRTAGAPGAPNDTLNPPPPLAPGIPTPAVPDTPTAEPMKDLRAQLRDMNDAATPRTGVFLSTGNLTNLQTDQSESAAVIQRQADLARSQGRVIDLPNGSLILKNKAAALKAQQALKTGTDPQVIIGQATGAGDGKETTDTLVVQGQTPDGAVAVEKTVAPAEVPGAVQDTKDQGKQPVVTTIPEALQRRAAEIQAPPPEAQDMPPTRDMSAYGAPDKNGVRWRDAVDAGTGKTVRTGVNAEGQTVTTFGNVVTVRRRGAPAEPETGGTPASPEAEEGAESAPAGESEAPTAQRGIIKTGGGERAVVIHDATPDAEGKITVSPIDEEGEPGPQIKVPAEALQSKTEAPKAAESAPAAESKPASNGRPPLVQGKDYAEDLYEQQVKADADAAAANPNGKRPPLRQGVDAAEQIFNEKVKQDVAASTLPEAKADAHAPILDQLKEASDDLTKQDQPLPGRKRSGSVEDRAGMIGNFARVLKSVAGTMEGEDAAHAVDMAKKYERVDLKSSESLAKNQGAGHTEFDIAKENLQNAARKLWDPNFERPEPKLPVQEKLKARAAAKKAEPIAERKVAPKEKPVEKTKVIADVEYETKPKQLTKGEQLKLGAAGKRLIAADDEHLDARTSDIDKLIKEIYGHRLSDEERTAFIKSLTNERAERLRPKSRDEEIDEEFADNHRMEDGEDDALEHQVLGRNVHPDIVALHQALEKSGVIGKLREGADRAQWRARDVMNVIAKHANGAMQSFLQKIAQHVPEDATFKPVTAVGNLADKITGLYTPRSRTVQARVRTPGDAMFTHTAIHEITHAATYHLMQENSNHPAAREAANLHQMFLARLRAKYGDLVQQHWEYFNGMGPKPENFSNDLYGITNPAEHMAEVAANGRYRELIAKSEQWKQPNEGYLGGSHNLAKATFEALKKLFGFNRSEGTLLTSTMRNLENVMEAQTHMFNERAEDAVSDMRSLAMLDHDPKPLKDEPRLRGIMGSATADTVRQFYRSVNSGALHALRRLVLANEKSDQLVRSNAHWFGKDNEHNPLRQWDGTKQDAVQLQNKILERGRPAVIARQRLDRLEDKKLGQIQIESQQWGFDPDKEKVDQTDAAKKTTNFDARFDDFRRRWLSMTPEAKNVFRMESEHNAWSAKMLRKAGVDASLDTFSDKDVTAAQRSLLYSARTKGDFDALIGQGKQIDVGDRNEDLKKTLQELAAGNQTKGHYFHLGRTGDYVVEVNPEVEREFDTQAEAESHAAAIRELGPNSKAKVTNLGGKYQVSGKATYLSMHNSAFAAEREANRLRAQGHDVGPVTNKIESQSGGALTHGMQTLVAEAQRKLERRGAGPETQALSDALRGTFVQMVADRSAYAASKLARKGFGGVKPEEMGRNFAAHVQSSAWNIANLGTTFRQGEALGKLRDAAKRPGADVSQTVVYKRGAVLREIGKRAAQEVSQYGVGNPVNAVTAKLGYMNYLASPAHTLVNGTQNFTTGLPVGIAKWGAVKTIGGFAKATRLITGPTFRSAMKAFAPGDFNTEDMVGHVIRAVAKDKDMGKWAPHLQQMLERGALNSTFANEIGHQSQGANRTVQRVFDMARVMPQMAEVYNRVSSALVALEATGGDVTKATDYVKEVHVDYTAASKPRTWKMLAKVPGANTVTMFKTYIQGMAHLLYSNIKNIVTAESKSRGEAAKTVAGLILAQSMVAGVVKGALIEPLRLAAYTYNQLFGSDDEYHDLDNTTRRFLADAMGRKAADAVAGGLPHLLGFDLSSRMGLSDLFLHDPPDLLHADSKEMMQWVGEQLGGPVVQAVAENKDAFTKAMDRGDAFGAIASIIPLKLLRDISQATEIATTGKRAGNGGQMTEASGLDAAYRAIGLKPADVEQAQEKQSSIIQYKGFVKDRKQRLLNAYGSAEDKGSVMDAIMDYNHANPANRIQPGDLPGIGRSAQRTTDDLQGGQERDPNISDLVNY